MDILSQMMRLPFSLVAMSVEPFLRMARDADAYSYDRRPPGPMMPFSGGLPAPAMQSLQPNYSPPPAFAPPPAPPLQASASLASVLGGASRREDLGDNMVKVLRWWIVWTKPDEEDVFKDSNKVVNYPTNMGSITSQILLEWARDESAHLKNLRDQGLTLSPKEKKVERALVNTKDWRYLQVKTELVERYALEDKYYDRRQTHAQERIADYIGGDHGDE